MVKVSVIVPVYNNERYVKECLESIVNQSMREIEIIVVNDGSTDGTINAIENIAAQDERVHVYSIENSGYGCAVNYGMERAHGEYIGIVESDDYIEQNMYEELYEIAHAKDLDIVKGDFYKFTGTGLSEEKEYISMCYKSLYNKILTPVDDNQAFAAKIYVWAGLYKKSFMDKYKIRVNESKGASYQDNGLWFLSFFYAQKVYFVNKAFYHLRRDNAESSVFSTDKVECIFSEYQYIESIIKKDKERFEKVQGVFWFYRYKSYMAHFGRISSEYYRQFARLFRIDFKKMEVDPSKISLFTIYDINNLKLLMEDEKRFIIENQYSYLDFVRIFNRQEHVGIFVDETYGILLLKTLLKTRIKNKQILYLVKDEEMLDRIKKLDENAKCVMYCDSGYDHSIPVIICCGKATGIDNYLLLKKKGIENAYIHSHRWYDNSQTITFSIIVPMYNAETTIERCLKSIRSQKYQKLEIICVDDGSTDSSADIVRRYAEKDSRIRLLTQKNSGVVAARKNGVMAATGDYVGYVDADDWIDDSMYIRIYRQLILKSCDVYVTACIKEYEDGTSERVKNSIQNGFYSKEELQDNIHCKMLYYGGWYKYGISQYIWNKVYKREVLLENQMKVWDDIVNGEDAACVYPCLMAADSIVVDNSYYYHYCVRTGTMTSLFDKDFPFYASRLYEYLKNRFGECDRKEELLWQLDYYYMHFNMVGANKFLGINYKPQKTILFGDLPYNATVALVVYSEWEDQVKNLILKCPFLHLVNVVKYSKETLDNGIIGGEIALKPGCDTVLIAVPKECKKKLRAYLIDVGIDNSIIYD